MKRLGNDKELENVDDIRVKIQFDEIIEIAEDVER